MLEGMTRRPKYMGRRVSCSRKGEEFANANENIKSYDRAHRWHVRDRNQGDRKSRTAAGQPVRPFLSQSSKRRSEIPNPFTELLVTMYQCFPSHTVLFILVTQGGTLTASDLNSCAYPHALNVPTLTLSTASAQSTVPYILNLPVKMYHTIMAQKASSPKHTNCVPVMKHR